MSVREIIIRNRDLIDEVTSEIRRWSTQEDSKTDLKSLHRKVEDEFFNKYNPENIEISDIKILIESIYKRVSSKYGILNEFLNDSDINEIMVNGPSRIFIEKSRQLVEVDDAFTSEKEVEDIIRMFSNDVHREVNEANPIVDARLPQGYRINGVLKNIALNGPILTIRKFSEKDIELEDLISYGSITRECCSTLTAMVKSGYNIFISGGTSSGKTTFLNALASSIKKNERVIIIEDSSELKINHLNNKVHMECRAANSIGKGEVTMENLIRTSLRMRPDRIIVGEVRGKEVVDMVQAMNTGHEGSMSTGHGNSIKGMLNRLETMYLMDSKISIYSVRNQISNAIDVFVHLKRDSKGKRRVVEVAELVGFDGEEYILNYLFVSDFNGDLVATNKPIVDRERLERNGYKEYCNTEINDNDQFEKV